MLTCERCGNQNSDQAEFCFECGAPLRGAGGHTLLDRRFLVQEVLECSETSELYKVQDKQSGEMRVLKAVAVDAATRALPGFHPAEAVLRATSLQHPNLATVFSSGTLENGKFYVVSELVEGESVRQIMEVCGAMPAAMVVRLACDALRGLHCLHQHHMLHGSLSPSKVMVYLTKKRAPRVKLIQPDFLTPTGTVKPVSPADVLAGKGKYCSPEQLGSLPPGGVLDARSDLYSLGLVIYELLQGNVPYSANTVYGLVYQHMTANLEPLPFEDLDPETAREFNDILFKALANSRDQRFPDALSFEEALNALDLPPLTGETIGHFFGTLGSARPSGAFSVIEPPTKPTPPPVDLSAQTILSPAARPSGAVGAAPPPVPSPADATVVAAVPAYHHTPTRLDTPAFERQLEGTMLEGPLETREVSVHDATETVAAGALLGGEAEDLGKGFTNVVGVYVQTGTVQTSSPASEPVAPTVMSPAPPKQPRLIYEDETAPRQSPAQSSYATVVAPVVQAPEAGRPGKSRWGLWAGLAGLLVVLAVAGYLLWPKGAKGTLALQVMPWGTIVSLEDSTGKKIEVTDTVTPVKLELPVGTYKAYVKVADTANVLTVSFTIQEGKTVSIVEVDEGYVYDEFLNQIL